MAPTQPAEAAVVLIDRQGRVVEYDGAAEQWFGPSCAQSCGAPLAELILAPGDPAAAALSRCLQADSADSEARPAWLTGRRRDGVDFPMAVAVMDLPGHDQRRVVLLRDVSAPRELDVESQALLVDERFASERAEAEAAQQRLGFLADASALLDRSLDPVATLQSLTALCVPRLGELCVIDLLTAEGAISGAVAASATDPATGTALERLRRQYPLRADGEHPVARVLRSGQAVVLPELSNATLERIAESEEHLRFMRRVQYRSAVVAPLRARGRTLGALSVLHLRDAERYGARDLQLVEELAVRAAMALDNAMLYAEREEDEAAARFLVESTELLSGSLDYEQTLAGIAELAVPTLADWCAVDVLDGQEVRRLALAHSDEAGQHVLAAIKGGAPRDATRPAGVARVLASGSAELFESVSDELLVALAQDDEHLRAVRSIGVRSLMVVPMQARGRTIGAITLVTTRSARRYDDRDLELARELGRRAGLAVDNARLYQQASHIAVTLQQSLLPPELPDIPGLQLAARYRATGAGNEVGGDFYDLFSLDERTWAVVIGDVCGKGADAAALTALARYTIRAVASPEASPSEVLRALNQAILRQDPDLRFCTAVYARVSLGPGPRRLDLARAGHPAPLVRRGAKVFAVGGVGQLLGVIPAIALEDASLELAAGDTLVLYTDGLTDAGAPGQQLDEDDLIELIRQANISDAATLAASLEQSAVAGARHELRDDVAIVVLRVRD
jgi:PAS domain S-box-containing protein